VHVARVAAELGVHEVVVPPRAGVASAIGLLGADLLADLVRTQLAPLASADPDRLRLAFGELHEEARGLLVAQGAHDLPIEMIDSFDGRFVGQSAEVTVQLGLHRDALDPSALTDAFRGAYVAQFGIVRDDPIELVNLRVQGIARVPRATEAARAVEERPAEPCGERAVYFAETGGFVATPVFDRDALRPGDAFSGPAVVRQVDSSVVVPPGFHARVDQFLDLVIACPAA